jgi:hypothetical protein
VTGGSESHVPQITLPKPSGPPGRFEAYDGTIRMIQETKRFQGIGKTTRDAKAKAATVALKKLKDFMPGVRVSGLKRLLNRSRDA